MKAMLFYTAAGVRVFFFLLQSTRFALWRFAVLSSFYIRSLFHWTISAFGTFCWTRRYHFAFTIFLHFHRDRKNIFSVRSSVFLCQKNGVIHCIVNVMIQNTLDILLRVPRTFEQVLKFSLHFRLANTHAKTIYFSSIFPTSVERSLNQVERAFGCVLCVLNVIWMRQCFAVFEDPDVFHFPSNTEFISFLVLMIQENPSLCRL